MNEKDLFKLVVISIIAFVTLIAVVAISDNSVRRAEIEAKYKAKKAEVELEQTRERVPWGKK